MDSFEFNKIAGGVLGTALLVMALSIGSEIIFEQHAPEKPGYVINVPKEGEGGGNAPPPVIEPIAVRLAKADPKAGANTAKACAACHTLEKGQPAKIGPNLWGVVGGPDAHMAGFGYSEALQKRKAEGKTWTFDELDHFLTNPKGYIPGVAMNFGGIKDPQSRANVIDYLRTLSDSPLPLPPVEAAPEAPAGAAPAEPAPGGETPATPAPTEPEKPGSPVKPAEPGAAAPAAPAGAAPAEPAQPAAPAAPAAPAEPAQPAQ
jgi:cytochrome c